MARATKQVKTPTANPAIIADAVSQIAPPTATIPVAVPVTAQPMPKLNHGETPSSSEFGVIETRINQRMLANDKNCVDIGRELNRLMALEPHKQGPKSAHVTKHAYIDQTFRWGRSTCYGFMGAASLSDWLAVSDESIADIKAIPRKALTDCLDELKKKSLKELTVLLIPAMRNAGSVEEQHKVLATFKQKNGMELTATDKELLGLNSDKGTGKPDTEGDGDGDEKQTPEKNSVSIVFSGDDFNLLAKWCNMVGADLATPSTIKGKLIECMAKHVKRANEGMVN